MARIATFVERLREAGTVGLDTVVFIYAFERHPRFGPCAQTVFQALEDGVCRGIASVLALGEVLTGAKRAEDESLLLHYRAVFERFPGLLTVDIDREVMEWMSTLRARYGIPTPDAVHIGTALAYGARAFVTNDARLRSVKEIDVLILSDFV